LIILGYYSSQPTGTLISPIPQATLGETTPSVTPAISPQNQPIIASDNPASQSATSEVIPVSGSNMTDKIATINPNTTEVTINDKEVTQNSQIYL